MVTDLGHMMCEARLKDLAWFCLEERSVVEGLIPVLSYLKREIIEKMEPDSSHRCPAKGKEGERRSSCGKDHIK